MNLRNSKNSESVDALELALSNGDWPEVELLSKSGSELEFEIYIRPDLACFAGHFPDQPVVPGVVQVHWAGQLSRSFYSCEGFSYLKKIKFNNVILPETSLILLLNKSKTTADCRFEYRDSRQSYSSGAIGFATAYSGAENE